MNYKKNLSVLLLLATTSCISAKNVTYKEDIYAHQADPALVALVDEVVQAVHYAGDYELAEPTKAGMLVNPWNRMVSSGVNPQTKNNFIVINPEWFKGLSVDEQKFLIGRCLVRFTDGKQPMLAKVLPFLFIILTWFLIYGFIWVINQTSWRAKNRWVKLAIAWLIAVACNVVFLSSLQQRLLQNILFRQEISLNKKALELLPNQAAAVHALEYVDATIKEGLRNGETLYKANEHTFTDFAKALKG